MSISLQGEVLKLDTVMPNLKANSCRMVLRSVSEEAAFITGVDGKYIFEKLMVREQNATSGIGSGVAIPHMYLKGADKAFMLFARLGQMVDFNALDGAPVDLVLLILSPGSDGPLHLSRLARVSRILRDETLRNQLRGTSDEETLFSLLQDPGHRRLAA